MKIQTFPLSYHFTNTAPLTARFNMLMASILAFIEAGQIGRVVKLTYKMNRVVRLGIKLETQNILLKRKMNMLLDKSWRDRVLKQLGGMRRLKSWEAAAKRNAEAHKNPAHDFDAAPVWLDTPERRAESERLKEHVRNCARACAPSGILRDKVRVDFDGQFRLAPIPRAEGPIRKEKIYTEASICDYFYNAMPFHKVKNFGPATVWPAEFRAAMAAEKMVMEARETALHKHQTPRACISRETPDTGPISEASQQSPDTGMNPINQRDERKRENNVARISASTIPTLRVIDVIPLKDFNDIFYDPPEPPT